MKIKKIELYQMPIKLKEPFVISLGKFDCASNVVVVVRTDAGMSGFGECSPFMSISGESMDTCVVVGQYLARVLIGKDPTDIETCVAMMDQVIYGNSSIKSAFDMALYDLASQYAGLPLFAFLGGNNNKILATDYTVSLGDKQKMVHDALWIKHHGFQAIKVKLGESFEKDFERIHLIREAVGKEIPLRIDANQGWNTETAIATLRALGPYNIQHCEEPIPRWNYMELPKVRKQSPIQIMADESCSDHHDAKRLIDLQACDQLNIKLGKSSGIFNALKIIQLAEQADMHLQVGGFLESRLGFTAAAHLALASDQIVYFDFDTPLMFTEDPVSGGITYDNRGVVTVPDSVGLGAWVDEDYLKGLKKVEVC
ncbi:MAG: dipeptide epimerase [Prolixibacteraceae bacterium]|jgi:L-alanine-DL-glutamate epimerase-like enolase superfamily enzyme|nr:dipeptide epimerase [Prolixibacteraceae bacterium]